MKLEHEKAKKIFYMYNGDKFQMKREEVLDEYQTYNISKEIEEGWKKEYIDKIKNGIVSSKTVAEKLELIIAYTEASKKFYNSSDSGYIDDFMQESSGIDSYTIIRLIELKLNGITNSAGNRSSIIKECVNSLRNLDKDELIVDKSYYINGELPDYLSNEKLRARVKNLINYWKYKI